MTYRGDGTGRREELPPPAIVAGPTERPRSRVPAWLRFAAGFVAVWTILLAIGSGFGPPPPYRPARTARWMDQACGVYGPAVSAVWESDDGPSPLYGLTCQGDVQLQATAP